MNPPPADKDPQVEWRRGRPAPKPGDEELASLRRYSPFWVLTLVFLTLIFLQATYLQGDFTKRDQIRAARQQLTAPLNKAQTINEMTEAVGRDLLALATNSPEAAKIIAEFKIQLNAPANPPR